jgi:radical SAM protein with 4Fe4S-binding SPASM domain
LAACGITRFQVSLDGPPTAHDTLRRWAGLFDRVVNTIEVAKNEGLKVHVCCTINSLNWRTLESFTEFVAQLGVSRLNFSRYVPTGRGTDALDLDPDEWRTTIFLCQRLKERYKNKLEIVSHLAQQILVDDEITDMPGFIGCQAGIGQGAVTANGTILPCVLLPVSVGNIRDQKFSVIWKTSPVIKALQNRDNLSGPCSTCKVKNRCGGCRAVAYAKTGNYLNSDSRCWLN